MDSSPPTGSAPRWSAGASGPDLIAGFAFAALLLAYSADTHLDPREVDALARRLRERFPALSGDDVIAAVHAASDRYVAATVEEATADVARLGEGLSLEGRRAFFSDLVAIADADGVVHPMESTILRHIAAEWGLEDEARRFSEPEG